MDVFYCQRLGVCVINEDRMSRIITYHPLKLSQECFHASLQVHCKNSSDK